MAVSTCLLLPAFYCFKVIFFKVLMFPVSQNIIPTLKNGLSAGVVTAWEVLLVMSSSECCCISVLPNNFWAAAYESASRDLLEGGRCSVEDAQALDSQWGKKKHVVKHPVLPVQHGW